MSAYDDYNGPTCEADTHIVNDHGQPIRDVVKPDTQKEAGVLAGARRYASDATDRAHAMQDDQPQDAALMARVAFYLDWLIEAYEIANATALAGLADRDRLDVIEEFLSEVYWRHTTGGEPQPVLKWFIGDGDRLFAKATTEAPTWRQAIDHFRELLKGGAARSGLPPGESK